MKIIQEIGTDALPVQEQYKILILKAECFLYMKKYDLAKLTAENLMTMSAQSMNVEEIVISGIAYECRERGHYVRALLYYQCSFACWIRDMKGGWVRRRTIDVINRGEKYCMCLASIGKRKDLIDIVHEYGIPRLREILVQYETGPEKLSTHRDLSIMGCLYHLGNACKTLGALEKCTEITKDGINIGMRSMREHKHYLLPKSHQLVAEAYLQLEDYSNARRWFESALGLCPFIVNWDFQTKAEDKKEFEKNVAGKLKIVKAKEQKNVK